MIRCLRRGEMPSLEHFRGGVASSFELAGKFKEIAGEILQALSTFVGSLTPKEIVGEVRRFTLAYVLSLKREMPKASPAWKAEGELPDVFVWAVRKLARERLVSSSDGNERELMAHVYDTLDPVANKTAKAEGGEEIEALAA